MLASYFLEALKKIADVVVKVPRLGGRAWRFEE
jgi:hypothetical protein